MTINMLVGFVYACSNLFKSQWNAGDWITIRPSIPFVLSIIRDRFAAGFGLVMDTRNPYLGILHHIDDRNNMDNQYIGLREWSTIGLYGCPEFGTVKKSWSQSNKNAASLVSFLDGLAV